MRPFVIAALAAKADRPVLAVTATGREAEDLVAALRSLLPPDSVADYPAWETLPHERLSPRADTVGRRLAVLRRLRHPKPARRRPGHRPDQGRRRAGAQRAAAAGAGLGDLVPVAAAGRRQRRVRRRRPAPWSRPPTPGSTWSSGEVSSPSAAASSTSSRRPRSTRCGWSSGATRSRRSATSRSPTSARSRSPTRAVGAAVPRAAADRRGPRAGQGADHRLPGLAEMLDKLADGIPVEGMEALAPVLVDGLVLLVDELPAGAHVVVCDPERVRTRASELVRTSQEFLEASWAGAAGGGGARSTSVPRRTRRSPTSAADAETMGIPWWSVTPFAATSDRGGRHRAWCPAREPESYRGDIERALTTSAAGSPRAGGSSSSPRATGRRSAGRGAARRRHRRPGWRLPRRRARALGRLRDHRLVRHRLRLRALRLAVLTETDLTGVAVGDQGDAPDAERGAAHRPACSSRPATPSCTSSTASAGYVELVQRTVPGATREYLVIEYAPSKRGQPGDRLYVPTDSLDQVTKYVGGEAPTPGQDGRRRLGEAQGPRPQGGPRDRRRADPALRRADGGAAVTRSVRTRRGSASSRTRSPTSRRPTSCGDRRGQARHGGRAPDGPGDLRRRRLRQDRDRGAGGVQGGHGRQAGRRAGADDAACAAALHDVLRALRRLPGDRAGAVAVPDRPRRQRRPRRASPTARSTSSSAPTGCSRRRCSSRTSASSSSTRSSGSASSTRSSSSGCAPRWTC